MSSNLYESVRRWTSGHFMMNSGYYAGRPPTTSDLNSVILESLYQGLECDFSHAAAVNFVRFVNGLSDLSASSFIVAFERFCANDCETVEVEQHKEDRIRITDHDDARDAQAFAIVAMTMAGERKSEDEIRRLSGKIKQDFIHAHLKQIPSSELKETAGSSYF